MAIRAFSRNLPTVAELKAASLGVERAWWSLLQNLSPLAGGIALVAENSSIALTDKTPIDEEAEIIRLLSFVARPDDFALRAILSRYRLNRRYAQIMRQSEPAQPNANARRYREYAAFTNHEGYRRYAETLPTAEDLGGFAVVMSNAPGFTWSGEVCVRVFNRTWDSVLFLDDPEDTPEGVFPSFFGFARHDSGWRGVCHILRARGPIAGVDLSAGSGGLSGDPCMMVCGIHYEEYGGAPGVALLALTDEQVDALDRWLARRRLSLMSAKGVGALSFLAYRAKSLGDGPSAIRRLFTIVGKPARFSNLDRLEREISQDPRFIKVAQRVARRRREKAESDFQRAATAGTSVGLWVDAPRYQQLPFEEPLYELLLSWHRGEEPPGYVRRMGPDPHLEFLSWALEGRGPQMLEWLHSLGCPEADALASEIVRISHRPFAWGTYSGFTNGPLREIKDALGVTSGGGADS